jgi:hypothetical protein
VFHVKRITDCVALVSFAALVAVLATAMLSPTRAQFAEAQQAAQGSPPPTSGGPVAIGQAGAQVDPQGKVAIVMAPPVAPAASSGGIIQLSAFGWLQPYVDTVAQALIVAFFGVLGKSKYTQWLDASSRDALKTFVLNRASSLIADGAVSMESKSVKVDNQLLFHAASEAATAIPDALKRFNLTPEIVATKIIDAIPQTQAGAIIVAAAHAESPAAPVPVTDRPSESPKVAAPNTKAEKDPPTSAEPS